MMAPDCLVIYVFIARETSALLVRLLGIQDFIVPIAIYEEWMVEKLGKKSNWKRRASCNYYVEKSDGCDNMRCRSAIYTHFCC